MSLRIALIGCGEAGTAFAAGSGWPGQVRAFDIVPERSAALARYGVASAASAGEAVAGADIVLSLVPADQAPAVAAAATPYLRPGALFCDCNSVAPQTKRAAAEALGTACAQYLDVAIMAPVVHGRLSVPLLVAGPAGKEGWIALTSLGFTNVREVGSEIGRASAIKMIRSVMVKGIEALTDEMMAGARAAGVSDEVLASLDASERARPWTDRAAYNLERMATHGYRRADEMEEVAATLRALGVEPVMTAGTITRQRAAARRAKNGIAA